MKFSNTNHNFYKSHEKRSLYENQLINLKEEEYLDKLKQSQIYPYKLIPSNNKKIKNNLEVNFAYPKKLLESAGIPESMFDKTKSTFYQTKINNQLTKTNFFNKAKQFDFIKSKELRNNKSIQSLNKDKLSIFYNKTFNHQIPSKLIFKKTDDDYVLKENILEDNDNDNQDQDQNKIVAIKEIRDEGYLNKENKDEKNNNGTAVIENYSIKEVKDNINSNKIKIQSLLNSKCSEDFDSNNKEIDFNKSSSDKQTMTKIITETQFEEQEINLTNAVLKSTANNFYNQITNTNDTKTNFYLKDKSDNSAKQEINIQDQNYNDYNNYNKTDIPDKPKAEEGSINLKMNPNNEDNEDNNDFANNSFKSRKMVYSNSTKLSKGCINNNNDNSYRNSKDSFYTSTFKDFFKKNNQYDYEYEYEQFKHKNEDTGLNTFYLPVKKKPKLFIKSNNEIRRDTYIKNDCFLIQEDKAKTRINYINKSHTTKNILQKKQERENTRSTNKLNSANFNNENSTPKIRSLQINDENLNTNTISTNTANYNFDKIINNNYNSINNTLRSKSTPRNPPLVKTKINSKKNMYTSEARYKRESMLFNDNAKHSMMRDFVFNSKLEQEIQMIKNKKARKKIDFYTTNYFYNDKKSIPFSPSSKDIQAQQDLIRSKQIKAFFHNQDIDSKAFKYMDVDYTLIPNIDLNNVLDHHKPKLDKLMKEKLEEIEVVEKEGKTLYYKKSFPFPDVSNITKRIENYYPFNKAKYSDIAGIKKVNKKNLFLKDNKFSDFNSKFSYKNRFKNSNKAPKLTENYTKVLNSFLDETFFKEDKKPKILEENEDINSNSNNNNNIENSILNENSESHVYSQTRSFNSHLAGCSEPKKINFARFSRESKFDKAKEKFSKTFLRDKNIYDHNYHVYDNIYNINIVHRPNISNKEFLELIEMEKLNCFSDTTRQLRSKQKFLDDYYDHLHQKTLDLLYDFRSNKRRNKSIL